jgi:hypothetical protein
VARRVSPTRPNGGPTPARRSRVDLIDRLFAEGRLTEPQVRAAAEIRRLWEALGRGLSPGARRLDVAPGSGRVGYLDPLERMTGIELVLYRRRYRPWAEAAARHRLKEGASGTWFALTIDAVIDNARLRALERKYGLRNGTARVTLSRALELYAVRAGWSRGSRDGRMSDRL